MTPCHSSHKSYWHTPPYADDLHGVTAHTCLDYTDVQTLSCLHHSQSSICRPLQATDYYQRALGRLGQSKRSPALWESVAWELSSTHFAVATLLQDHPPLSSVAQEQVRRPW